MTPMDWIIDKVALAPVVKPGDLRNIAEDSSKIIRDWNENLKVGKTKVNSMKIDCRSMTK